MLPSQAQAREFAERYTAAWCSQNAEHVAGFFAPDGSLTINNGVPSVGRAAIAEAARSFMTAFPDLKILMDDVRTNASRVEYHWTLVGTNTAPAGTGNRVRISGFESWRFSEEALIAESIGSFDAADYEQQLRGAEGSG